MWSGVGKTCDFLLLCIAIRTNYSGATGEIRNTKQLKDMCDWWEFLLVSSLWYAPPQPVFHFHSFPIYFLANLKHKFSVLSSMYCLMPIFLHVRKESVLPSGLDQMTPTPIFLVVQITRDDDDGANFFPCLKRRGRNLKMAWIQITHLSFQEAEIIPWIEKCVSLFHWL